MSALDYPPLAWTDGSLIKVGQEVHSGNHVCPRRFAAKVGTVASVVPTISESGRTVWVGELGVDFGDRAGLVWFRPDELSLSTSLMGSERPLSVALAGVGGVGAEPDNSACIVGRGRGVPECFRRRP